MVIARGRKVEQMLQDHMDRGGIKEILAADHMADFLVGVVDDDGQVIGGAHVAAGQNHIADAVDHLPGCDGARAGVKGFFVKRRLSNGLHGFLHVKPERLILRHRAAAGPVPAGAGIDQPVGAKARRALLRGVGGGLNVAPGAGAGIEQPAAPEALQCGAVAREAVGLAPDRRGPA